MEGQPRQVCAMYDWPFELSALPSFHLKPQYDSAYFRVLCAFSYSMPNVTCCPLLPVLVGLYGNCMWLGYDIMSAVERKTSGIRLYTHTHRGQRKELSWVGLEPITLCSLDRVLSQLSYYIYTWAAQQARVCEWPLMMVKPNRKETANLQCVCMPNLLGVTESFFCNSPTQFCLRSSPQKKKHCVL